MSSFPPIIEPQELGNLMNDGKFHITPNMCYQKIEKKKIHSLSWLIATHELKKGHKLLYVNSSVFQYN